jgi:transcriptional regulator with XRE-family HTH domain
MKLAERITRWRESREGLTKAELARLVGVSSAAVGQWEQDKADGGTEPTHDNITRIADAIGISLSVFWGEPPAERKRRAS